MQKRWLWLFVTLILLGGYVSETINLSSSITGSAVRRYKRVAQTYSPPLQESIASGGSQAAMGGQRPLPSDAPDLETLKFLLERLKNAYKKIEKGIEDSISDLGRHQGCRRLYYLWMFTVKLAVNTAHPYITLPGYGSIFNELMNLALKYWKLILRWCYPDDFQSIPTPSDTPSTDVWWWWFEKTVTHTLELDKDSIEPPDFNGIPLNRRYTDTPNAPITPPCYQPVPVYDPHTPSVVIVPCADTWWMVYPACGIFSIRLAPNAVSTVKEIEAVAKTHNIPKATIAAAMKRELVGSANSIIALPVAQSILNAITTNPQQFASINDPTLPGNRICSDPLGTPPGVASSPPTSFTTTPTNTLTTPNTCHPNINSMKLTIDRWAAGQIYSYPEGYAVKASIEIPKDLGVVIDHPKGKVYPDSPAIQGYLDPAVGQLQPDELFTFEINPDNGICGYHKFFGLGKNCRYQFRFFIISSRSAQICSEGIKVFVRMREKCGNTEQPFWVYWSIECTSSPTSPYGPPTISGPFVTHTPPQDVGPITPLEPEPYIPGTGGNCALDANNQCTGQCPQGETCSSPSAGSCQCCPANCAVGVECQSDADCDDHDQRTTDKCQPKPNCTLQCGTQCTHISIPPT